MDVKDGPCFSGDDVEILEKTTVYEGFFRMHRYRLKHRLIEGGWSHIITRECFDRGPAVGVLLYDPYRDSVVRLQNWAAEPA